MHGSRCRERPRDLLRAATGASASSAATAASAAVACRRRDGRGVECRQLLSGVGRAHRRRRARCRDERRFGGHEANSKNIDQSVQLHIRRHRTSASSPTLSSLRPCHVMPGLAHFGRCDISTNLVDRCWYLLATRTCSKLLNQKEAEEATHSVTTVEVIAWY